LLPLCALLAACSGSAGSVQPDQPDQTKGETYRLGAGDTINIAVFGEAELTTEIVLNDRGTFTYPYLGTLTVIDKTLLETQQLITDGLSQGYLVEPKVSVTMDSFKDIYVGGEVAQAGNFPFKPGLTLGKAILLAGDFTERASRNRIYVVSEGAMNSKPIRISMDYVLKPGDIITVQRSFF
jgi:protein involved in polysaccharide export with SLBB domain